MAAAPRRTSRTLIVVIAVVAVVVVIALALLLPAFVHSNQGSSTSSSGSTYAGAAPIANSTAQSTQGGGWSLVVSSGILTTTAVTENISSTGSSDCNISLLPGVPSTVTIPAGPTTTPNGAASAWLFFYRDGAQNYLLVAVVDGAGEALGTIAAHQACTTIFGLLNSIPGTVIDSATAVASVQTDASAFLAAHSGVNADYSLLGGVTIGTYQLGPEWMVNYTTCPVSPTAGETGTSFNATVNALTGAVIYYQTQATVTCESESTVTFVVVGPSAVGFETGQLLPQWIARDFGP